MHVAINALMHGGIMNLTETTKKIKKEVYFTDNEWERLSRFANTVEYPTQNAFLKAMIFEGIECIESGNNKPVPESDKEPFDVAKQYGLNMETGHNPNPVPEKSTGDAPDNVSPQTTTAETRNNTLSIGLPDDIEDTGF